MHATSTQLTRRVSVLVIVAALSSIALARPARADVLVVSDAGGGDFTDIASAVAAAQDGDLILVEPPVGGPYGGFTVDGRSLTISASHAGEQIATRAITVKNLAAGQVCVLRRLVIAPTNASQLAALRVDACAGSLRVESCRLTGSTSTQLGVAGLPAVHATSAEDLGLVGCELVGGAGTSSISNDWNASSGGSALLLAAGSTWVHDSLLTGGRGGNHLDPDLVPGDNYQPGNGGAGARLSGGARLSVAGCTLIGGVGGEQIVNWAYGLGGPAVFEISSSTLRRRDSVCVSGADAFPHNEVPPLQILPSHVQSLDVEARHLEADSPKREGETLTLLVDGEPGDAALLLVAAGAQGVWLAGLQSPLLVGPGFSSIALGSLDGSGQLLQGFTVPALPAVIQSLDIHVQLAIASAGPLTLENGRVVTLVDASF